MYSIEPDPPEDRFSQDTAQINDCFLYFFIKSYVVNIDDDSIAEVILNFIKNCRKLKLSTFKL